jgi:hypothetical protein
LEIHIEANVATSMRHAKQTLGLLPAAFMMRRPTCGRDVLDKPAAIVKPPMRSMMVGENICAEDVLGRVAGRQASIFTVRGAENAEDDDQEGYCERRDEQGDGLGRPENGAEDEKREAVALSTRSNGWAHMMPKSAPSAMRKMMPRVEMNLGKTIRHRCPDSRLWLLERWELFFWLDRAEDALATAIADHLGPDSLAVDNDALAELGTQLLLGKVLITSDDDTAVEEENLCEQGVELCLGLVGPGVRRAPCR